MKRLMIGQYGFYNDKKQMRDFRDDFFGIEACMMKDISCIEKLKKVVDCEGIDFGVHFPLRSGRNRLRDPQYLSNDTEALKESYLYMENELSFLSPLKPHYVLMHFPKPVLLDKSVDWSNWRFADDTEYYFEDDYSFAEFKEKSETFFNYFSAAAEKYEFIPVLEFDALNRYSHATDFLESLLKRFPKMRICLDIGRLHLQDRIDPNFDSFSITKKFAKYAGVIHLWNVKVDTNLEYSHYPPLPELKSEEGWADIERYLSIIRSENETCKVLFEHRSDLISDEALDRCYSWIRDLLKNNTAD